MSETYIQTNNIKAGTQSNLSVERISVKQNWNNDKVEVIGTGVTAAGSAISLITFSALGGPIGLIAGLAAATFLALGLMIARLVAQPKNVTNETVKNMNRLQLKKPLLQPFKLNNLQAPKEEPFSKKLEMPFLQLVAM